jgi:hypothetical protein
MSNDLIIPGETNAVKALSAALVVPKLVADAGD